MWAKVHSSLEEGEEWGRVVSLETPVPSWPPVLPAHSFKEASIAVTVGLLGPQNVSGLEGLAVLLLGSLNVVLCRAEEGR